MKGSQCNSCVVIFSLLILEVLSKKLPVRVQHSLLNADLGAFSDEYHQSIEFQQNKRILYSKSIQKKELDSITEQAEKIFDLFYQNTYSLSIISQFENNNPGQQHIKQEITNCKATQIENGYILTAKHCFNQFFLNGSIITNDGTFQEDIPQKTIRPWYNLNFLIEDLQERFELFKINNEPWFITDAIKIPITQQATDNNSSIKLSYEVDLNDIIILYGEVHYTFTRNYKVKGLNISSEAEVHESFGKRGDSYISIGKVTYQDDDFICYDAPTYPGNAGMPVLDYSTNKNLEKVFVGIHTKGSGLFKESCALKEKVIDRAIVEHDLWYLPIVWDLLILLIARYFYKLSSKGGKYGVVIFFAFFYYLFGLFVNDYFDMA